MDFAAARVFAQQYDQSSWEAEIREAYGPAAHGVIEMELSSGKKVFTTGCRAGIAI